MAAHGAHDAKSKKFKFIVRRKKEKIQDMNLSIVVCFIVFIFFKLINFSRELTNFTCSLAFSCCNKNAWTVSKLFEASCIIF